MNASPTQPSLWERTTTRRVLLWWCRWHIVRRLLVTVAVLLTLPVLFYAVENWRGKRAWDHYRRPLEAQGERFDLAGLVPPPVPDAQNLATAPVLRPIFDFTRGPAGLRWNDTNGLEQLREIGPAKRSSGSEGEPKMGRLFEGTFADLEACRRFYLSNTNYLQADSGGNPAQVVLLALGKFDPQFRELKAAADSRPAGRFPVHYEDEEPFAILLPHLATVKGLAATLDLRATARLELRQPDTAWSDWELGMRLADSIRDEPMLISHLVRVAMLSGSLQVIREGLVRHAWTEEQLAKLQPRLATVDLLAEYGRAMRGERACEITTVEWARRQGWRANIGSYFESEEGDSLSTTELSEQLVRIMPSGWYYRNMLTIAQLHQEYVLAAVNEQTRRVRPELGPAAERALKALPAGPKTHFAKMLFPAVAKAAVKSAQMQSFVEAARVACALERFCLANGQLPDSLNALVPRFLERIPGDVVDGEPLRYRRQPEGGYIVYSIGWNAKDDGGELAWTSDKKASVDARAGDWVWSLPR